jgi:hypothetical protein
VSARDRTVLLLFGLVAAAAAIWMLAISPKRKDAADLKSQISTAQQRLTTARAAATDAEAARKAYASDYATVARLGQAVPVDDDVPSLLYQLESAAHRTHVDFRSIKANPSATPVTPAASNTAAVNAVSSKGGSTAAPASSTTPSASAAAALPPGAAVGAAGFPTMPFSFGFQGSYFGMQRFLDELDSLTSVKGKAIRVKGRLLSVDGFQLKAAPEGFPRVDATVSATAYLLPADEGLTAGATATSPSSGATASNNGSASGPTTSLIGSDR